VKNSAKCHKKIYSLIIRIWVYIFLQGKKFLLVTAILLESIKATFFGYSHKQNFVCHIADVFIAF